MNHPGELKLRRFLAEEPLEAEIVSHLRDCADCEGRLGKLREEQKAFEAEIPFERFAAGVQKSARVQGKPGQARSENLRFVLVLAACFVALVGAQQLFGHGESTSRVKGGDAVDFVVAGPAGPQRNAAPVERLAAGERVRIGVTGHRYVLALSIDERGEVSPLYAEALMGEGQTWLPESLEFTGAGLEHVVVVLSDGPVDSERVAGQLKERFRAAGGDVGQLGTLDVPGVQVHRTFIKP